jgi:hypothetical protein
VSVEKEPPEPTFASALGLLKFWNPNPYFKPPPSVSKCQKSSLCIYINVDCRRGSRQLPPRKVQPQILCTFSVEGQNLRRSIDDRVLSKLACLRPQSEERRSCTSGDNNFASAVSRSKLSKSKDNFRTNMSLHKRIFSVQDLSHFGGGFVARPMENLPTASLNRRRAVVPAAAAAVAID